MSLLKSRITATDRKLDELKQARKVADKARRQAHKQTKADRERKVLLVGEAVLRRVDRGEWDEALANPIVRATIDQRCDAARPKHHAA
ncbi:MULTISPECIES: hypothetical protein [Paraburkholderia]|uniref:hypothetical protein n=1 Tax=Paraburkholderia TaxID=1822464 RepID=UPI00036AB05A|nr:MULTISPECIES: hypothetical protein [Paraburkholderia]MDH6151687.1 hypothetical protein [Paraburkholderia sp. WSM4179]